MHRLLRASRPTIEAWIRRFEAEHCAGLMAKRSASHAPAREVWLPLMGPVSRRQKAHPDAGRFRLWRLLARSDIAARTVGRGMALHKWVYHDIPHVPARGGQPGSGPYPQKARSRHPYGVIDGRRLDVALEGVWWWRLIMLEGDSRTMEELARAFAQAVLPRPTNRFGGVTWPSGHCSVEAGACEMSARGGAPHTLRAGTGDAPATDAP